MLIVKAGERMTDEAGVTQCFADVDIHSGDTLKPEQFRDWSVPAPKDGDVVDVLFLRTGWNTVTAACVEGKWRNV